MATANTRFVQQLNFQARDASNESAALRAAVSTGLIDALKNAGPSGATLASLSESVRAVPRGVRSLLEVLAGLRFVRFDGQRYVLANELVQAFGDEAFRRSLEEASAKFLPIAELPAHVRGQGRGLDLLGWLDARFGEELSQPPRSVAEDFYDRLARQFLRTQALVTASDVGLLKRLVRGDGEVEALAGELNVTARGLRTLARVLETMELVTVRGGRIAFSELAQASFDEKSLPYFERALPATMVYWEALGALAHAVKTGEFVLDLKIPAQAARVYGENAARITGIFASHLRLGRHAVALVKQMRSLDGARVLDVGTGSGVWGAAFAEGAPTARVTYLDSDHVLATVKENLARIKLLDRAQLWVADCTQVDLGEGAWDVVLLPQILPVLQPHERKAFFARVGRGLAKGGVVAVSGYVLNDLRDGPMDAVYFSLRRYLTNEGDVLSFPEMKAELAAVGLTDARIYPLPVQELVLATRGELPWPTAKERPAVGA